MIRILLLATETSVYIDLIANRLELTKERILLCLVSARSIEDKVTYDCQLAIEQAGHLEVNFVEPQGST